MNGGLPALLASGPAHSLAIDGDNTCGNARHCGDPGDEAALELLGIQRREDIAEVIMRRRAILERAEPTEQRELLGAEKRDLSEAFRASQHRQQTQQQNLVERIGHLAKLARVPQTLEIAQKYNRLGKCRIVRCRAVHGHSPACESRSVMDLAL